MASSASPVSSFIKNSAGRDRVFWGVNGKALSGVRPRLPEDVRIRTSTSSSAGDGSAENRIAASVPARPRKDKGRRCVQALSAPTSSEEKRKK
ncbi:hypothetical protein MTO96_016763 [Rhipicephalus appendiculatus]